MTKEYSFVEVLMVKYNAGVKEYGYTLGTYDIITKPLDLIAQPIVEVVQARNDYKHYLDTLEEHPTRFEQVKAYNARFEPDTLLLEPVTCFSFRCFGNLNYTMESSVIAWELANVSDHETVFGPFLQRLEAIGDKSPKQRTVKESPEHVQGKTIVRFVTLWVYESYQDIFDNTMDVTWKLLGPINITPDLLLDRRQLSDEEIVKRLQAGWMIRKDSKTEQCTLFAPGATLGEPVTLSSGLKGKLTIVSTTIDATNYWLK